MKKLLKMFRYPGYDRYIPDCDTCELFHTTECDQYRCQARINARLGEYEHTGRTPEEVAELVKENDTLREQLAAALKFHKIHCVDCKYFNVQQCEDHDFSCNDCPEAEACHCKDCKDGSKWVWAGGKL